MTINCDKRQLVCGLNAVVQVYKLDTEKECGHYLKLPAFLSVANVHTDIVRCLAFQDFRVYSAGYGSRLLLSLANHLISSELLCLVLTLANYCVDFCPVLITATMRGWFALKRLIQQKCPKHRGCKCN